MYQLTNIFSHLSWLQANHIFPLTMKSVYNRSKTFVTFNFDWFTINFCTLSQQKLKFFSYFSLSGRLKSPNSQLRLVLLRRLISVEIYLKSSFNRKNRQYHFWSFGAIWPYLQCQTKQQTKNLSKMVKMSTSHFPQFRTDIDKIFKLPVTFVFRLSFFKFCDLKFVRQVLRLLLLLLLLLFLYQKFSFKTIFQ